MNTGNLKESSTRGFGGGARRGPLTRRRLLRGATASVPVIMTLNSGATLAAASSLLAESSVMDVQNPAVTADGSAVCVANPPSMNPVMVGDHVKYAPPIDASVVPNLSYTQQSTGDPASALEVCTAGPDEVFLVDGMAPIEGKGGLLVSCTALSSIAPTLGNCSSDNAFL